jgi:hypothetical protein
MLAPQPAKDTGGVPRARRERLETFPGAAPKQRPRCLKCGAEIRAWLRRSGRQGMRGQGKPQPPTVPPFGQRPSKLCGGRPLSAVPGRPLRPERNDKRRGLTAGHMMRLDCRKALLGNQIRATTGFLTCRLLGTKPALPGCCLRPGNRLTCLPQRQTQPQLSSTQTAPRIDRVN